jgi:hypothetical protein
MKIWRQVLSLSRMKTVGCRKSRVGGELELHDLKLGHVVSVDLIRGQES